MRQLLAPILFLALTAPAFGQSIDFSKMNKIPGFEPVVFITGIAGVEDGDGITFGKDIEVRLNGIAAPEDGAPRTAPGGSESTENLRKLVERKEAYCLLDGIMSRKRLIGICYVDGADVGRRQIEMGHTRDCPHFSKGRYADAEKLARESGHNLSAIYRLPRYCG